MPVICCQPTNNRWLQIIVLISEKMSNATEVEVQLQSSQLVDCRLNRLHSTILFDKFKLMLAD